MNTETNHSIRSIDCGGMIRHMIMIYIILIYGIWYRYMIYDICGIGYMIYDIYDI
jgi:hypothetical protein